MHDKKIFATLTLSLKFKFDFKGSSAIKAGLNEDES